MEAQGDQFTICSNCQYQISSAHHFCRNCGQQLNHKEFKQLGNKKSQLNQIFLFFSIELCFCITALLIQEHTIGLSIFLDIAMAITAVLFFGYNWDETKSTLKWSSFSFKKILLIVPLTVISSYLVQFIVAHLNHIVFNETYTFYATYAQLPYGNYIMVVSVALFPALFEELAYRGFLIQKLLNIVDKKEAMYISSILFFFVHFSMTSFFWMLPFAILLAYVRLKENTLWYGVVIHFFFNLTACLVETYNFDGLF